MIPRRDHHQGRDNHPQFPASRPRPSRSPIGDRPVQVGSHYHFFETIGAQYSARKRRMRLNIPAGTAVRFEPGQTTA